MMTRQTQRTILGELVSLHSYLSQAKPTDKVKQMLERTETLMRQAIQNLKVSQLPKGTQK